MSTPDFEKVSITFDFDPNNPNHEAARLGFMIAASEFDIEYREMQPSRAWSAEELLATSQELYGTRLYAQNAAVVLKVWAEDRPPELRRHSDLRDFLLEKGYDKHGLHGNLGRTFNTLLAIADVQYPEAEDPTADKDYVDIASLEASLRQKFTYDGLRTFTSKLDTILRTQLSTGQPAAQRELLIGGRLKFIQSKNKQSKLRDELSCEQVKRADLAVIANTYMYKRSVARFLEEESQR